MNAARGHLFFYWRMAGEDAEPALATIRHWQQALMADAPSLIARLYLRRDDSGRTTLMETYVAADEAWCTRLQQDGDTITAPWRSGERHLERFDEVR